MYRCLNCNRTFDEPIIIKNHPINDEFYEEEEVCPYCRNNVEELEQCERCGEYAPELKMGLCDVCYGDLYGDEV